MSKATEILRNHVASYKTLSRHRQNCLDVCGEVEILTAEVTRYERVLGIISDKFNEIATAADCLDSKPALENKNGHFFDRNDVLQHVASPECWCGPKQDEECEDLWVHNHSSHPITNDAADSAFYAGFGAAKPDSKLGEAIAAFHEWKESTVSGSREHVPKLNNPPPPVPPRADSRRCPVCGAPEGEYTPGCCRSTPDESERGHE